MLSESRGASTDYRNLFYRPILLAPTLNEERLNNWQCFWIIFMVKIHENICFLESELFLSLSTVSLQQDLKNVSCCQLISFIFLIFLYHTFSFVCKSFQLACYSGCVWCVTSNHCEKRNKMWQARKCYEAAGRCSAARFGTYVIIAFGFSCRLLAIRTYWRSCLTSRRSSEANSNSILLLQQARWN